METTIQGFMSGFKDYFCDAELNHHRPGSLMKGIDLREASFSQLVHVVHILAQSTLPPWGCYHSWHTLIDFVSGSSQVSPRDAEML